MALKVLLINPGQYLPQSSGLPASCFQPLGLGYLAEVLRQEKFLVAILDILAEGFDQEKRQGQFKYVGLGLSQVEKRINNFRPEVVGISIPFTSQAKAGHEIAKLVKKIKPKIKVIIGGPYSTTYYETTLKDKNIDFVVRGEGEITLLELLKKIEKGEKNFKNIQGLAFKKNGQIEVGSPRPPILDLDNYQVAWDLLPMEKYFQAAYQVKSSRSISTFGKRWATIFTSRGCPFTCTFCAGHLVMGRRWRPRSIENVLREMDYLINQYQIQHFDIEDDNFTLDKERAKKICDGIIKERWPIQWSTPNGIRADTVDEELIKKMKQSGCVRTIVAPESGDQWVVDNLMKKRINLEKVIKVVKWCKKYGIEVDSFFILGMPREKEKSILKTIDFAKKLRKLGVEDCGFCFLVPHRGTEVYEEVRQKGWLRDFAKENLIEGLMMGEPLVETPYLSVQRLKELYKLANKVNPSIPLARLRLVFLLMIKSPLRFFKLTVSYLVRRFGYSGGLLGAE